MCRVVPSGHTPTGTKPFSHWPNFAKLKAKLKIEKNTKNEVILEVFNRQK
jgi:hypothetical protein